MTDVLKLQFLNPQGQIPLSSATNHLIDASNEAVAWIGMANTINAITHGGFRYGARGGTPPTWRLSLQSIDPATGFPSGTVLGGGSPASVTFTPPADTSWDGTWRKLAFANSYTPASREEIICLVIEYSSGTIDGTNNSSFTRGLANHQVTPSILPYHAIRTSGTWAKSTASSTYALYTASEAIGFPGTGNVNTLTSVSGRRLAMHFTLPSGVATSYTLRGIHFHGDMGDTASTVTFGVWDSSNVQQAITGSIDTDGLGSANAGGLRVFFATPPVLTPGTKYYIGVQTASTNAHSIAGIQLADADDRKAYPLGENRGLATYDGTTWTETNTVLPIVDLILDDITAPSGGGIVLTGAAGMRGGING